MQKCKMEINMRYGTKNGSYKTYKLEKDTKKSTENIKK